MAGKEKNIFKEDIACTKHNAVSYSIEDKYNLKR